MVASLPQMLSVSPGKVIVSPASEPQTLLPPLAEREGTRETSPRASDLCGRVVDLVLIRKSAAPRRGLRFSSRGRASGEQSPPMGLPENPTSHPENQAGSGRKRQARRPRTRRCLLKGCEAALSFAPRASALLCSGQCRRAARLWSQWKAQEEIPGHTAAGKRKRNGAKPALRGARPEPKTTNKRSSWRGREGNH